MANKIYTNHTLEEYKKKYRNRQYRLLKVTKKEVEDFHRKNPTVSKDYLLKDRKWWLIGDTYYEIPKAPRYTWFRNLNAGVQIATCALLGAGVATAVVVPTVIAINNKNTSKAAEVTGTGKDLIKSVSFTKQSDGSYKGKIEIADGKSKSDIQEIVIKVGNKVLTKDTDYSISDSGDITIKAGVVTNNDNITIEVVKKDSPVTPTVTEIAVDSTGIKTHNSGDPLDLTGIKIKAHLSSGTDVDVEKSKVTFNPAEGSIINTTHNVNVTATYENVSKNFNVKVNDAIAQHTVTFKVDGQVTSTQTVNDGEKASKPDDPTKAGYTFKCWNNGATEYDFNQPVTKDLTLDAMFGATSYTITYHNVEGATHDNPISYSIETETINLKNGSKNGYNFEGWYIDSEFKTAITQIAKGSTGNKDIYAKWSDPISYTITYNLDSGTNNPNNPKNYTIETEDIELKDATKDTYTFAGWYDQTTGGNKVTEIKKGSYGNKTLYARWNEIHVTGVSVKESTTIEVNKSETLVATVAPSDATNKNVTWSSDKTSVATVNATTGVVTAVAEGTANITVTTEDGGKTATCAVTVTPVKCVELDKTTLELFNGKEGTINASLSDKGTGEFSFSVTEGTDVISVTQDSSKFTIKALKKGDAKVVISCNGYASASCSVTVEELVKYKIKWDATVNFYGKGDKKLYEYARDAKKITFTRGETIITGAQQVGEVRLEEVRADFENDELKIWSNGLVQFNDNDLIESKGPFNECKNLETIDLEYIDTSEMTTMIQMFSGDTSLKEIKNISSLKTAACIDMTQMFYDCNQLTSIDLSSFDTSKVNNMALMFGSTNFTELDLSSFNTSKVNNFPGMFLKCGSLKKIYASSNFVIPNGANTALMFSECSTNLKGGKGTTWSGEHVDGAYARIDDPDNSKPGYFTDVAQKSYNIDWTTKKFGESSDESLHDLFKRAKTVEFKLDEDTTSGTLCGEEESDQVYYSFVDNELKVWSKQKIRFDDNDYPEGIPGYNAGIFSFCGAEYFDEEEGLYGATSLKLNNIDTSHVTDMSYMFNTSFCRISSIDLSSLDTSNATKMNSMFAHNNSFGTSSLSTIVGLDKFNTEKVTDMSYMFSSLNISTLDLSSFNTSNVGNFESMFAYNGSLSTIYASNSFEIGATATSTDMFADSTKLVGGKGTTWSSEHVDGVYARIDDPDNSKPGYFTEKK